MGKNLRHQEPNSSVEGHNNQGCIGGILHHLQGHHKRLYVKKRLPYRKHNTGKHTAVLEDAESSIQGSPEAADIQENSTVETQLAESGSTHKSSMKSRIKAMITDEMSKRKGRHRRTASCPVREPPADANSIHLSDPELPNSTHSSSSVLSDTVNSVVVLKHSRSNASSVDYLRQSMGRLPVRDHTLLHDENIYAIAPTKYASLQESKLFWDALDLLNMRKELFLKILKDPNSSLVQNRRNSTKQKFGLTKSVSFPAIGSAERRASMLSASSLGHFSGELEISGDTSPTMVSILTKRCDNKAALKRFKNIREKIKYVIRDKRKEKNMIIMDGVLHKIPYGRRASKHMKPDKAEKFSKFTRGNSFGSDGKSTMQNFKRTSLFHESFDKYDRLLETINSKDDLKDQDAERIKFKTANNSPIRSPANLKRILSLPDLSSHSYFQVDDSESLSISNREGYERKLSVGSENKMQLGSISESESQDSFTDAGENFDDSADSSTDTSIFDHDLNRDADLFPVTQSLKLDIIPENDSIHQDDSNVERLGVSSLEDESSCTFQQDPVCIDSSIGSESTANIDTLETRAKQFYNELFQVRVDLKNQAEYNYVKDVLELAGFTRDELLGQWYSPENPLDPLVFNEVEGCFMDRPDNSGFEEGGSWYQLLMFDLINEVLLSIYERSFCYWPVPLTCPSHMHRMPKRNRVLEEVWADINCFLSWRPENDQSIDDAVSRDLGKADGWINLQYDAECVALEMEELILDELIEEIIFE